MQIPNSLLAKIAVGTGAAAAVALIAAPVQSTQIIETATASPTASPSATPTPQATPTPTPTPKPRRRRDYPCEGCGKG